LLIECASLSSLLDFEAFGRYVKEIFFESHIPRIPNINAELIKLRKYSKATSEYNILSPGYAKYKILTTSRENIALHTIIINKNVTILLILFNLGLVKCFLHGNL